MSKVVSWMEREWLAFDCETTGVDTETDLIVSSALLWLNPTAGTVATSYDLLNWGVDIPEGAAKIHGLTRPILAEKGTPPPEALEHITTALAEHLRLAVSPVVGMNLVFDLTMLDRNCRRAGVVPLVDRCEVNPIVDAMVLDKYVDPFRKGKRNLEALATHYRVDWRGEAHNALSDARVAAGVAWRIGRLWPNLGAMDPVLLHNLQTQEKQAQDASFRKYLLEKNRDTAGVDGVWPLRPWLPQPAALVMG